MNLIDLLRSSARANHLANQRLARALATLSVVDFHAPRTSFFPGLAATLHHLLAVDEYYLAGLQGRTDMVAVYEACTPCPDADDWQRRQFETDRRLIAFCDALDAAAVDRSVHLDRGSRIDTDRTGRALAHLFMHQTHHRGQVHAMLSGTAVKPPQLDDFLLASDAPRRVDDLAALGWTEADLIGPADAQSP
jgi:uncharacterized damage-inducible protein DinB